MSRSLGATSLTTRSPILSVPMLMSSSPAIMRRQVVLPQPDGPTKTMNSPSRMSRLKSSTALTGPYSLLTCSKDTVAIDRSSSRPALWAACLGPTVQLRPTGSPCSGSIGPGATPTLAPASPSAALPSPSAGSSATPAAPTAPATSAGPSSGGPSALPSETPAESPARTTLSWSDCGAPFECATLSVPLDYKNPTARSISLALIRLPASDPARRIGSLLTNPGGPGASGVDFVRSSGETLYSETLRARFDLVGFDPRGAGASTPIH